MNTCALKERGIFKISSLSKELTVRRVALHTHPNLPPLSCVPTQCRHPLQPQLAPFGAPRAHVALKTKNQQGSAGCRPVIPEFGGLLSARPAWAP